MDLSAAVAVSQCADRIERGCRLRAELVEAGSAAQWARRRAGVQQRRLPGLSEPSIPGVFERFSAQSVYPVPWESAGYPAGLRHLAQPPPVLFVRGSSEPLPAPARCVALVGARRSTELGRLVARDLAAGLARAGVVVVSGLAMGIDAAAHEGALDAGGQTIAVLASAVDDPTPRCNGILADEILSAGSWLVSERPPSASVRPADFPRRNRLVAALVSALVVVEAGLSSGTWTTVGHALQLGIDVGAVPGPVTSPASRGANELLRRGAQVVTSAEDILAMCSGPGLLAHQGPGAPDSLLEGDGDLSVDERSLLRGLPGGSGGAGQWLSASGLGPVRGQAALCRLLSRGVLRRLSGGRIARVLG